MVVGQKLVYLPNLVFTMVRMSRLQPNEVAFHVPMNIGKLDIKSYLENLYKLKILNVRTMNIQGKRKQNEKDKSYYREPSYKRAFVTLDKPFVYPTEPNLEDFGKKEIEAIKLRNKLKMDGLRVRPRPEKDENKTV